MSSAGLSKSRLKRMRLVLSGYVERKEMPGLVALVSRHDDVHVETLGTMSVGHPAPMKRDTIFRIASLAKPVTAVAGMQAAAGRIDRVMAAGACKSPRLSLIHI